MQVLSFSISHWLSVRSQSTKLLLVFLVLFVLAIQVCRVTLYRDPTSIFFDPNRAYKPGYSTVRRGEADGFIQEVLDGYHERSSNVTDPTLCVGIASVARDGARYFRTAVGSFLHGLDESERNDIYLILFIAQTDPTLHPAWPEGWMERVAEKVITYGPQEEHWEHLQELERNKEFKEKALFDYTYLLKACNRVGSKYIAMIEDDVIAMDGWYHRTRHALAQAEEQTKRSVKDSCEYT